MTNFSKPWCRRSPSTRSTPTPPSPARISIRRRWSSWRKASARPGVLSPILVVQDGMRYRIVAGERRFRAARLAGLSTVPCIVRDLTNEQQMEAALIENLQRQDLNPIEEASAIRSLMDECGYTQEQAAKKLGKSRPAIANTLRLLTLPKQVLALVQSGELSAGHAQGAGRSGFCRAADCAGPALRIGIPFRAQTGRACQRRTRRSCGQEGRPAPAPDPRASHPAGYHAAGAGAQDRADRQ